MDSLSVSKIILFLFVFIFMTGLGLWSIISGACNPLGYFSGVKGAVHGYTFLIIGIMIAVFGIAGIVKSKRQLFKRRKS